MADMSSHQPRTIDIRGGSSRTTTYDVPPLSVSKGLQIRYDRNTASAPKRSSVSSVTSSGRRSDGSLENGRSALGRPSALPRSTSSGSQARLSYIASSRPLPTYAGKSPPLQALVFGLPTSNIPRLDTSRSERGVNFEHRTPEQTASPMEYDDRESIGTAITRATATSPAMNLPARLIPELQALAASNKHPTNPASSSIGSIISSPSTQFTTSSSPWSASTTTTTPLSWSSASPSIMNRVVTPSSKRSHTVPMPAIARATMPKLPAVKEIQIPASSSRITLVSDSERSGRRLKKTIRESPEPMPPPRSSSLKRTRSRSNSGTTTKTEHLDMTNIEFPRPPVPMIISSGTSSTPSIAKAKTLAQTPIVAQGHSRLQEALKSTPQRIPSSRRERPREALVEVVPAPKQLLEPLPIAHHQHRRFPSLSRRHVRQPSPAEPEIEKQSARSRLAKFSKLALFGRSKIVNETEAKPNKLQSKKGPTAGTGHEGYGKFIRRGRKQSIGSSIAATDSETSIASVSRRPVERRQSRVSSTGRDQSDLDDFASIRSKPVVMVGGSQRGRSHPFPPLPKSTQFSNTSMTTLSSIDSYPAQTRLVSPERERFPHEREQERPNLAARRSHKFAGEEETFSFPQPIETQLLIATPALDSRNTTQSSEIQTPASAMYRVDPDILEKQRGKGKKLKWNIFRRKDSISEAEEIMSQRRPQTRLGMSVNVAPAAISRPVPWYAVMDSESDVVNTTEIGQYLRDAQESPEREAELISVGLSDDELLENPYRDRESVLLPQAPTKQVAVPPTTTGYGPQIILPPPEPRETMADSSQTMQPKSRQPRLAQVGRIPKVVPTKQLVQPEAHTSDSLLLPVDYTRDGVQSRPSHEQLPRLDTSRPPVSHVRGFGTGRSDNVAASIWPSRQTYQSEGENEFLQMSQTRNSDFTSSSESSGIISVMGPPYTSIGQFQGRYSHLPHEDEVWNEYNDFMDDIMSPESQTMSPPKHKLPKSLRTDNATPRPIREPTRSRGLAVPTTLVGTTGSSRQFLDTPPLVLSSASSLAEMASSEEIRLRRSRIAAELHASYAPSSPFSLRDFLDDYGRPASGRLSERHSVSSAAPVTPTLVVAPAAREQSRTGQYENAANLEAIERTQNPTKHSDRQYASLMVSRWLSFGRVLFSPAHQEVETTPQRHVLVIDGLGSEDWSIYCAVTYQAEQAFVHDLKEQRRGKKPRVPQSMDNSPANHRRSEVASFNERFPFPPAFFAAIVVRFPPAMPDSKLKNIISECRRTLAPGGFLELMVLDLDIVNMGVATRRAIKDLKIKMTGADRSVSLKPIIDNVQTILGSNGFSNLNRCVVGVPVVGKPAGSMDSSSESRSSSGSATAHGRRSSAGPRPYGSLGGQANFSLNDLVADHSENADAKIGRMVSRTARSWWQHCFEAGIMTDNKASRSILANKEILHECKTRAANFKLLIAYTQKPMLVPADQRRRTLSEPTVPTLATAGGGRMLR